MVKRLGTRHRQLDPLPGSSPKVSKSLPPAGLEPAAAPLPEPGSLTPWGLKTFNTNDSQLVPHVSTELAQRCLVSEIGRDRTFSPWYDRTMRLMGQIPPTVTCATDTGCNQKRPHLGSNQGPIG